MSRNKLRFYAVLGILAVAVTGIALALPVQRAGTFWLSYGFALLAIAMQLYAWPRAFAGKSAKSKFYGFPIARVSTLYLIAQLALSLLFIGLGSGAPVWLPALLYTALFAAAAVGLIVTDAVRDEVERQDGAVKESVKTMRDLTARAALLVDQCGDAETRKALAGLTEALRYADPVSSDSTADAEANLSVLLDELGEAVADRDDAASKTLCARASALLAERNRLCRLNK